MKTYTILNCEGNILQLEIEKDYSGITLTFCANMNSGVGQVYFSVTEIQLLEYFNSKITLSQIVQNAHEDRFLLMRYSNGYIVKKAFIVHSLQCGDILFGDILIDMKIKYFDVRKLLSDNDLSKDGFE